MFVGATARNGISLMINWFSFCSSCDVYHYYTEHEREMQKTRSRATR